MKMFGSSNQEKLKNHNQIKNEKLLQTRSRQVLTQIALVSLRCPVSGGDSTRLCLRRGRATLNTDGGDGWTFGAGGVYHIRTRLHSPDLLSVCEVNSSREELL